MIPDAGPEEGVYLNDPNNPRTLAHDYAVLIRTGKKINTLTSKAGTIFAKRILIHLRNAALLLAKYYAARRTGKSKIIRMNILKRMRGEYGAALNAGVSYVRFLRKYFSKKNRVITKKILQDWQVFKSAEKVIHDAREKLVLPDPVLYCSQDALNSYREAAYTFARDVPSAENRRYMIKEATYANSLLREAAKASVITRPRRNVRKKQTNKAKRKRKKRRR